MEKQSCSQVPRQVSPASTGQCNHHNHTASGGEPEVHRDPARGGEAGVRHRAQTSLRQRAQASREGDMQQDPKV